jgi:hypothetical protein
MHSYEKGVRFNISNWISWIFFHISIDLITIDNFMYPCAMEDIPDLVFYKKPSSLYHFQCKYFKFESKYMNLNKRMA